MRSEANSSTSCGPHKELSSLKTEVLSCQSYRSKVLERESAVLFRSLGTQTTSRLKDLFRHKKKICWAKFLSLGTGEPLRTMEGTT